VPADRSKLPRSERLRALLPDVWALVRPRRGLLVFGMVLMAINRVSGLVLPASTKYLVDDIIGKREYNLLRPLILSVMGATLIQGITSYGLTQLLSKAAQRLIAELRRKVQMHVGRLPVSYYDVNKSGMLVSRIMSDVEGVRNLIGTGLVEFVGGLLTAVLAFAVLVRLSPSMTGVALGAILAFGLALRKAFGVMRPIFRERGQINAEVTGRLTESLGGVRVVKGYHAEAAEAEVFSGGVQRLLDNVMKSLTSTSLMSLGATVMMGVLGALVMYLGARQMIAHTLTLGQFFTFTMFLAFLIGPVFQIVGIGTQISEALAGLERTREVLRERPEDEDPRRRVNAGAIQGEVVFEHVTFSYDEGRPVLGDGAGRPQWLGEVHHHRTHRRVLHAARRHCLCGRRGPFDHPPGFLPHAVGSGAARHVPVRRHYSRERSLFPSRRQRSADSGSLPHRARRRIRRGIRQGLRHDGGRARCEAIGRPEAAGFDRARHPGRSGDSHPG
jgi:subfamily B ATP-binding cassette protein MsbA